MQGTRVAVIANIATKVAFSCQLAIGFAHPEREASCAPTSRHCASTAAAARRLAPSASPQVAGACRRSGSSLVAGGGRGVGRARARAPVTVAYAHARRSRRDAAMRRAVGVGLHRHRRPLHLDRRSCSGRIDRYFVEEGQSVHKGDPLVQLDDRDYRAAVGADRGASARGARQRGAGRVRAQARPRAAAARGHLAAGARRAARTRPRSRARPCAARGRAAQAHVNLEYTLLRAPTDGVVLAKLKEVGEIAVPGGFAGSGDLMRLANLTDMRAEVDVNEADLNRVRMGQPAHVTPDAYPDARYDAEVVKMYPQVDRQKGTLKIEVQILEPDARLLPDMSARVSFLDPVPPEQQGKPALMVPAAALHRDAGEQTFVWTVSEGRVHRVPVTSSGQVGNQIRIIEGLSADQSVVVSDDKNLSDGAAVTVAGG